MNKKRHRNLGSYGGKGIGRMAKLLYQGHGSLRLTTENGTVVYVDPYAGEGYGLPADLILVTHQHGDHNQIAKPARKPGCTVYQNFDALQGGGYRTALLHGLRVEAVEAYNRNHPREECVGYLVEADGLLLYFAGDTSRTRQMEQLAERKLDYAFLPGDGVYNMTVEEAGECARLLRAGHSVPIHLAPGRLFSEEAAARFDAPGKLVLRPGEEILL